MFLRCCEEGKARALALGNRGPIRYLPLDRHRFSVSFLRFSFPFPGTLLPSSMCVQRGAPHAVRTWMTVRGPLETEKRNGETKRTNGVYPEARGGWAPQRTVGSQGVVDSKPEPWSVVHPRRTNPGPSVPARRTNRCSGLVCTLWRGPCRPFILR